MNTTKKHLTVLLLGMIIILPLFTTSCFKKGDEDPFVSMYTRKARVTGEWTISETKWDIKRDDGNMITRTVTETSGLDWTQEIEIVGTDSTRSLKGDIVDGRNVVVFYSDGRFTYKWEYEYDEETTIGDDEGTLTTTTKIEEEMSGTWNFLHNIDDYKKKERLALVVEESKVRTYIYETETTEDDEATPQPILVDYTASSKSYANGAYSTIWTLVMLKNKTIKTLQDVDDFVVEIDETSPSGVSYTEVGYKNQTLTRE